MNPKVKSALSSLNEMRTFLILWATQAFSGLGSAMTSYALIIWSYTQEGSLLVRLFVSGKGSGAACFFAVLGVCGVLTCVIFRRNRHLRAMQTEELRS